MKIGFVYTSMGGLVSNIQKLAKEMLPGVETVHLADSGLVADILKDGITSKIRKRLMELFEAAVDAGCDLVVCACSTVGDITEAADQFLPVPILRIDQAMIQEAVTQYQRIGVLASVESTIEPTTGCIRRTAAKLGRDVTVRAIVAEGAYQAQASGDTETHDALLEKAARQLVGEIDVLVLAQGSMSRMETSLRQSLGIPVLSSPSRCMEDLLERTRKG